MPFATIAALYKFRKLALANSKKRGECFIGAITGRIQRLSDQIKE